MSTSSNSLYKLAKLKLCVELTKSVYIPLFKHTVAASVCKIEENQYISKKSASVAGLNTLNRAVEVFKTGMSIEVHQNYTRYQNLFIHSYQDHNFSLRNSRLH